MPEIFVQQCRFRSNVFSGNEFCPNRDIQQNVFTELFVQQCRFRSNVFSGNQFCRNRDIQQNVFGPNGSDSDVIAKINMKIKN